MDCTNGSNQRFGFSIVYMRTIPCNQIVHIVYGGDGNMDGIVYSFCWQSAFIYQCINQDESGFRHLKNG